MDVFLMIRSLALSFLLITSTLVCAEEDLELLWKNVLALIANFWKAGYSNVIVGSFFSTYKEYQQIRQRLPKDVNIFLVHLCASKPVRDQRRIEPGQQRGPA